jgi:hypothetical protein
MKIARQKLKEASLKQKRRSQMRIEETAVFVFLGEQLAVDQNFTLSDI